jgi:hypothetical protein
VSPAKKGGRVTPKQTPAPAEPAEPDPILEAARETRRLDLDAARAARVEKLGPAPVVVVGGEEYELPLELPGAVVTAFGMVMRGDVSEIEGALRSLFGEHYEAIAALKLSWPDQQLILEGVLALYDFDFPE